MRAKLALFGLLASLMLLPASTCTVEQQFVQGMDKGYAPVKKDYEDLLETKSGYDPDTKRIRKQQAEELQKLIDSKKK